MSTKRKPGAARPTPAREFSLLRARLAESEQTLRAIRNGEVDTVLVAGAGGPQVFTLNGAEHTYRLLIETMNEGALTLSADHTILYANQCFARLVKTPLEQVTGTSFRRFLSVEDLSALRALLRRNARAGLKKIQGHLITGDTTKIPVQISIHRLAKPGSALVTLGMVVTDMSEARRSEEQLRALANRVAQVQESERGRVALELHDNITQMLCGVLFCSQALAKSLSAHEDQIRLEAEALRDQLRETIKQVDLISRNLRPSILEHLGIAATLRDTCREFSRRTGVPVLFDCAELGVRLHADFDLVLYRILQEALKNVEHHARALRVRVRLTRSPTIVQLTIRDDGVGFDPELRSVHRRGPVDLGLFGMRERAQHVGGSFHIKTAPGSGTQIVVRVPLRPIPAATESLPAPD